MPSDYRFPGGQPPQPKQQPAQSSNLTPQQQDDMTKLFAPLKGGVNIMGNTPILGSGKNSGAKPATPKDNSYNPQTPNTNQPNAQGYTQTTSPYGVDQMNPGVGEQFWNQNQNLWMNSPTMDWAHSPAPGSQGGPVQSGSFGPVGQGSQFWNQVAGGYNKASEDLTPQFNKAYDNAENRAVGTANAQAAARGAYGSSTALNNVGNVINDFEGQRGKAATDFMLQNKENQLGALGAYGSMAFGAGKEGMGLDTANLQRLNSGFSAAGAGQGLRDNRIQGMYNNIFQNQQSMLPWATGQYDQMLGNDQDLYSSGYDTGVAKASDQQGWQTQQQGRVSNDAKNAFDIGTGVYDRTGGRKPPGTP